MGICRLTFLEPEQTGLLVIDVQERIFPALDRGHQVVNQISKAIKGVRLLGLPVVATEQYPEGLGRTLELLGDLAPIEKTCFSAASAVSDLPVWLLCGVEAHVCVLQTAKELMSQGKEVVLLSDAITSRSIYNLSIGISEARDAGARISSVETVLFELMRDAKHPAFKQMSQLLK